MIRSILVVIAMTSVAAAGPIPAGFSVSSRSPDGKLGVLVPDESHVKGVHQNAVVELASGNVVATIDAPTVFEHQSHAEILARWSADGSTLVWYIDGKWGSWALVVLVFDHGVLKRQTDVREAAVQHALATMRAAQPAKYAEAKRQGARDGSWYRDGFAIDVRPANPNKPAPPLAIAIEMTANPKQMDDRVDLAGTMTGIVGADGKLTFSNLTVTR